MRQIRHHTADNGQLLKILVAEQGQIRLHDVEQLGHYRGYAVEVAGAACPAKRQRQVTDPDGSLKPGRIHLCCRRGEDNIHTALSGNGAVPFQVAGVALKVLGGTELDRVDKDGEYQDVAALSPFAQQRGMSFVQKAHGGNKGDAFAFEPEFQGSLLHFEDGGDDLHDIQNLYNRSLTEHTEFTEINLKSNQ